jgi:dTMP kinase
VRGKFITLEGMDGAGKSTHIPTIIGALESAGHRVISTREPGGTRLGEQLRELLLHEAMHPETEALLMFAARRQHMAEVIEPALAEGTYVVSDRFSDASFAYQHGARGVAAEKILQLETWVHPHLQPDLTILFDVPVEVSIARLAGARSPDKFEQQNAEFFTRIRNAYLQRAAASPERFRVIDGNQPIASVEQSLLEIIAKL